MPKTGWKGHFNTDVVFKVLNEARQQKDGKVSYSGWSMDTDVEILYSHLNHNFPLHPEAIRSAIRGALFIPTNNGRLAPQKFLTVFDEKAKALMSQKAERFHILTSLSFSGEMPFRNIQLDSCRIRFGKLGDIRRYYHPDGRENYARDFARVNRSQPKAYPYVIIEAEGFDHNDAFYRGFLAANKFRSLLNYFHNIRHLSRMSSGFTGRPVNKFRWGGLHTIHRPNGADIPNSCFYENDFVPERSLTNVSEESIRFQTFYRRVSASLARSPIGDDVWKALGLYCDALDKSDYNAAFVDLWQVIEFLTNTGRHGYDVTVRRASATYKEKDYYREMINHLRMRRNILIHRGVNDGAGEELMYRSKMVAENLIKYFILNKFRFKSIIEYSEFLDMPDDISNLKLQLERVQKFRR
jgi:hypothetical protein